MKKITIVVCSIFLAVLSLGVVNASHHEKTEKSEHSEHGKSHENEFYGTVQQIPEGHTGTWVIDGKNIQVTKDTYIEKEHGQPEVGSYVEVEGHYVDKVFTARKIETKRKHK